MLNFQFLILFQGEIYICRSTVDKQCDNLTEKKKNNKNIDNDHVDNYDENHKNGKIRKGRKDKDRKNHQNSSSFPLPIECRTQVKKKLKKNTLSRK